VENQPTDSRALFQARYVLTTLGVETRFTARGDALKGELEPDEHHPIRNPVSGEPIEHVAFTVRADGTLHLDDPPALRGLPGLCFAEVVSIERLLEQIGDALERRVASISSICEKLQRMGIDSQIDGERVVGVAQVDLDTAGVAALEIDDDGLAARYVVPALGDRSRVSLEGFAIDLDEVSDRVDIELALASRVEATLAGRRKRAPAPAAVPRTREAPARLRDGRNTPTLSELAARLGDEAFLRPGFTLGRALQIDGEPARFIAEHVKGQSFRARVRTRTAVLWQGELELSSVSDLEEFIPGVLTGTPSVSIPQEETATPSSARDLVAGLLPPVANEVWVMDVRVEEDDGVEIRYRGLNVGGITFGAPRVLPRPAFESSYAPTGDGGYRMLVQVLEVADDMVTYRRLDAKRLPAGTPRSCPLIVFLANYVAEAAAY
jgi:hypothetical protein